MGVYDQAARWAAESESEALIQRLMRETGLSLGFREWIDSRTTPTPGEEDRTADRVAALSDPSRADKPWLLLIEFQAQHDPEKLDITLQEAARLRVQVRHGEARQGKYNVLPGLVYLRGRCPKSGLDMTGTYGHGIRNLPALWEIEGDDAREALDDLEAGRTTWGILFWIALMHRGDDPAIIARWRELALKFAPEHVRTMMAHIAHFFAELAGCFLA